MNTITLDNASAKVGPALPSIGPSGGGDVTRKRRRDQAHRDR
jgi:hypothetical protein